MTRLLREAHLSAIPTPNLNLLPSAMEFYGIVSTACSLSYQIYSECSASRGQFKALSNQALSLHDILKTIQGSCRRRNLTDAQLESLKRRIIPLTESLGQVDARLKIYSSLGTSSPKFTDKIAWAAGGGSSEIRDELNTQIIGLTAWNTT